MASTYPKLLSGRVKVAPFDALDPTRHEFLGLNQAEPNLGTAEVGNVLTIGVSNTRVWTSDLTIRNLDLSTGNISNVSVISGVDGGDLTIVGNLVPVGNLVYNLGSDTERWNDLYLSGNTIYLGNIEVSETDNLTLQLPANVNIGNASLQEINGNLLLPDVVFIGNVEVNTSAGNLLLGNLIVDTISATGNISSEATITAEEIIAPNVYINRGTDPNDWNALTEMGAYKVNRSSWSGTAGTPADSTVFVGLLNVVTSEDTTTQIFYPGAVDINNAKIQWNRSLWNGSWTSWYKIVNDGQIIDAGLYN